MIERNLTRQIAAMARAVQHATAATPSPLSLPSDMQREYRNIANAPSTKRAKVKAARKAAQQTRKRK